MRQAPVGSRLLWEMGFLFVLSIAAVALVQHFGGVGPSYADEMEKAADGMSRALAVTVAERGVGGPPLDPVHDVNRTGMIGGLFTSTTSTTGNLAAKRTTTNPDVAGLIVHLFREAGVRGGDYVAVGGSGSFSPRRSGAQTSTDSRGSTSKRISRRRGCFLPSTGPLPHRSGAPTMPAAISRTSGARPYETGSSQRMFG